MDHLILELYDSISASELALCAGNVDRTSGSASDDNKWNMIAFDQN